MPSTSKYLWACFVAAILLLSASLIAPVAAEGNTAPEKIEDVGDMPFPSYGSTAVFTGSEFYIFGGTKALANGTEVVVDSILRYNPSNGSVVELAEKLPTPMTNLRSFWDGTSAYVMSGSNASGKPQDMLIKFTPPNTVTVTPHYFPYGVEGLSIAWTGEVAYLVGNCLTSGNHTRSVIRFDPKTTSFTITKMALPIKMAGTKSVWTGSDIIIFGGRTKTPTGMTMLDSIYSYDPATNTSKRMNATLPYPVACPVPVLRDGKVYLLGGSILPKSVTDSILVYDIASGNISDTGMKLPYGLHSSGYAEKDGGVYIFGAERTGAPGTDILLVTFASDTTDDDVDDDVDDDAEEEDDEEEGGVNAVTLGIIIALVVIIILAVVFVVWRMRPKTGSEEAPAVQNAPAKEKAPTGGKDRKKGQGKAKK